MFGGLFFGDVVFNFEVNIIVGCICFYDFLGDLWGIFFFYFWDFILVCIIEFGRVVKLVLEFVKRNVKLIVFLIDSVEDYFVWSKDINVYNCEEFIEKLFFFIIDDRNWEFVILLGMLDLVEKDEKGMFVIVCVVFVFGFDKKLKLFIFYLVIIGRNFDEIFRVVIFF